MKHASVFSGIGGPEVAAAMLGWDNLFHCEINPFGRAVLDYWFPDAESYEDITKTDFTKWRGQIDVLTGGFPCQPFSYAGKRNGAEDDRYLWPEMLRVINEVRPTWFVGENVAGIRTMVEQGRILDLGCESSLFGEDNDLHRYQSEGLFTIERICRNLESAGYSVQPIVIPACAVGAPHRRDRIFFIAHTDCGADLRGSRENAGESREEWIQERDADIASDVRGNAKNAVRRGCLDGGDEKQGSERNERNTRAGDCQRVCSEKDARLIADTSGEQGKRRKLGKRGSCWQGTSQFGGRSGKDATIGVAPNADRHGLQRPILGGSYGKQCWPEGLTQITPDTLGYLQKGDAWRNFPTLSPVHRGNDGIPFDVDGLTLSFTKWRNETLKAYGNAIVPQVMYEIFKTIEQV